jgi:hypothetical protein
MSLCTSLPASTTQGHKIKYPKLLEWSNSFKFDLILQQKNPQNHALLLAIHPFLPPATLLKYLFAGQMLLRSFSFLSMLVCCLRACRVSSDISATSFFILPVLRGVDRADIARRGILGSPAWKFGSQWWPTQQRKERDTSISTGMLCPRDSHSAGRLFPAPTILSSLWQRGNCQSRMPAMTAVRAKTEKKGKTGPGLGSIDDAKDKGLEQDDAQSPRLPMIPTSGKAEKRLKGGGKKAAAEEENSGTPPHTLAQRPEPAEPLLKPPDDAGGKRKSRARTNVEPSKESDVGSSPSQPVSVSQANAKEREARTAAVRKAKAPPTSEEDTPNEDMPTATILASQKQEILQGLVAKISGLRQSLPDASVTGDKSPKPGRVPRGKPQQAFVEGREEEDDADIPSSQEQEGMTASAAKTGRVRNYSRKQKDEAPTNPKVQASGMVPGGDSPANRGGPLQVGAGTKLQTNSGESKISEPRVPPSKPPSKPRLDRLVINIGASLPQQLAPQYES